MATPSSAGAASRLLPLRAASKATVITNFNRSVTTPIVFNYTRLDDGCNKTTHDLQVLALLSGSKVSNVESVIESVREGARD